MLKNKLMKIGVIPLIMGERIFPTLTDTVKNLKVTSVKTGLNP